MSAQFISAREVAELCNVKIRTVYAWVERRAIPCYRPTGGVLLFDREEIIQWIKSGAARN